MVDGDFMVDLIKKRVCIKFWEKCYGYIRQWLCKCWGKQTWTTHKCLNGILSSRLLGHPLMATSIQGGPSALQHPSLFSKYNSFFMKFNIKILVTLLIRWGVVMGQSVDSDCWTGHALCHHQTFAEDPDSRSVTQHVGRSFYSLPPTAQPCPRVITGDETWFYSSTLKQSNNSHNGKVQPRQAQKRRYR